MLVVGGAPAQARAAVESSRSRSRVKEVLAAQGRAAMRRRGTRQTSYPRQQQQLTASTPHPSRTHLNSEVLRSKVTSPSGLGYSRGGKLAAGFSFSWSAYLQG